MRLIYLISAFIIYDNILIAQNIIGEYINSSKEYLKVYNDTLTFKIIKDTVFTSYSIFKGKYDFSNQIIKANNNQLEKNMFAVKEKSFIKPKVIATPT